MKNPRASPNTLGSRTKTPSSFVLIFFIGVLEKLLAKQQEKILAVFILHGAAYPLQLVAINVSRAISNLFRAGHHESLPLLDCLDIECSFHEGFVGARVQPSHAAAHDDDF